MRGRPTKPTKPMKPEQQSKSLLGVTRSLAKMFEYRVPAEDHIKSPRNPSRLFSLAIGLLGDYCSSINTEGRIVDGRKELRDDLRFSAQFFDAYRDAKVDGTLDPYVSLVGAATYYLCELPGSASVLAKQLPDECPDLDGRGLEQFILWLLRGDFETSAPTFRASFGGRIVEIATWLTTYFGGDGNANEATLFDLLKKLRRNAYAFGTSRQLLLADIACALARMRYLNSARYSLPIYSELTAETWAPYLSKATAIRELWPAQHLIGRAKVFAGTSAIIQMPTSAGKTRGTELIIRSSFLADRSNIAVIVAPFRALCHEIRKGCVKAFAGEAVNVDELTDVTQNDFDIEALLVVSARFNVTYLRDVR